MLLAACAPQDTTIRVDEIAFPVGGTSEFYLTGGKVQAYVRLEDTGLKTVWCGHMTTGMGPSATGAMNTFVNYKRLSVAPAALKYGRQFGTLPLFGEQLDVFSWDGHSSTTKVVAADGRIICAQRIPPISRAQTIVVSGPLRCQR